MSIFTDDEHETDNEQDLAQVLLEHLADADVIGADTGRDGDPLFGIQAVSTFEEAGVLTSNRGLVIDAVNGAGENVQFQVTIVESTRR